MICALQWIASALIVIVGAVVIVVVYVFGDAVFDKIAEPIDEQMAKNPKLKRKAELGIVAVVAVAVVLLVLGAASVGVSTVKEQIWGCRDCWPGFMTCSTEEDDTGEPQ